MAKNSYTHDNATAPGIALAHTVYGEPTTASMRPEMAAEGTVVKSSRSSPSTAHRSVESTTTATASARRRAASPIP